MTSTSALKVVPATPSLQAPSPAKAVVRQVPGKGRGIFAAAPLAPGEVIMVDPAIELSVADCAAIKPTLMEDYHFAHPASDEMGLVVFGLASLANHSDHPTAATEYSEVPGIGWMVTLVATRALAADEEITRRYACEPWFAVSE